MRRDHLIALESREQDEGNVKLKHEISVNSHLASTSTAKKKKRLFLPLIYYFPAVDTNLPVPKSDLSATA